MSKTLNQTKGYEYEKYVANILRKEYDDVWLWKDIPESTLIEKNIIANYNVYSECRRDIGIDIVAVKDGVFTFVQCKNYDQNVCVDDIAGFLLFMITNNVDGTVIYSNGVSKNLVNTVKDKADVSKLKISFRHIPFENKVIENVVIQHHIPRDYQLDAMKAFNKKYHQKCVLAMPCGTGKTFTVSLLARRFNNVVVLSPLKQLTADVTNNLGVFLGGKYKKILISSDGCRDSEIVCNSLKDFNIVGSTYDSADVLVEVMDTLTVRGSTIIIIDEYHNLSNNNLNNEEDYLNRVLAYDVKKIYLSATPNLSMDYDVVFRYEWAKAIEEKQICDFNIIIPTNDVIDEDNLKKVIKLLSDIGDVDEKMIKKGYFLIKSLLFNGSKKCIVYLTTTQKAQLFNNVINGLFKLLNIECEVHTITNKTSKGNRENSMFRFRNNTILTIILNVHILDEGIDVPECDSVYITQPNDNIDNLIQRMCRCNRRTETKTKCHMYIWTTEEKVKRLLQFIKTNTYDDVFDKVKHFDTITNSVEKPKPVKKVKVITKVIHGKTRNVKFQCEKCDAEFTRKESLIYHTTHNSCTNLQYLCSLCGKRFGGLSSMYRHKRTVCKENKSKSNRAIKDG
ncbi:DEAD/SNF2-like helicase [Yasminevirus sp. GU-2018]|uniref:DEAD/SNF2-like helicase n=1 Tax=Yasminevirus sp. GU-2018 TaxID=2420051 RepID=A0A5K0U6J8_9VIRU|nr:DEAD/SNF2-like helicase [Yasminevirus sp. GU-2018]